jgi:hypothetical protein
LIHTYKGAVSLFSVEAGATAARMESLAAARQVEQVRAMLPRLEDESRRVGLQLTAILKEESCAY